MKKISPILIALALTLVISCGQKEEMKEKSSTNVDKSEQPASQLVWLDNVEDAVKKASSENKIVFIDFTGSDWCKWCIKLNNEVFSHKEFADYAKENLVLVKLDFPRTIKQSPETVQYNREKMDKYGIQGFPTIVLLNANGEVIGNTGYREGGPVAYTKHLDSFKG